jgi:hypothetical protein
VEKVPGIHFILLFTKEELSTSFPSVVKSSLFAFHNLQMHRSFPILNENLSTKIPESMEVYLCVDILHTRVLFYTAVLN